MRCASGVRACARVDVLGWRREVIWCRRDGHGSASCADLGGVDRHDHRRDLARADRAGGPRRGAEVPGAVSGARVSRSRWRRRRAGGSWSRSSSGSAPRCTWPSRREASALKGKKKRAKTDWADARHLRELLLIGRLPESWIPPAHLLDLRARVRTPASALPSAHGVAAADARGALSPRRPARPQPAHAREPRVARRARAPGRGARAARRSRSADDRRARHPARPVRSRAARSTRASSPAAAR